MNAFGIALLWCVLQVTLAGLLAAGLYLVVRRIWAAAAVPVVLAGLTTVVALSLLVSSPWPRWVVRGAAPVESPAGIETAADDAVSGPANVEFEPGAKEAETEAVPLKPTDENTRPAAGGVFWQAFLEELSKPQPVAQSGVWQWPAAVGVLLLAAMACGLIRLILGVAAVRRERLRSRPVDNSRLIDLVDVLCAELGCRRAVEVRECDDLATAATIGWRRPVLLAPADWTSWTDEECRAVLAHELAHVRSHDCLMLLLGQLGVALHFYNPLVHWLAGRLRLEQELAADAAAASVSGGQRAYLLTIARLALRQQDRPLPWPARTFLPTRTTFLRRIAMLRDSKLDFERVSPAVRVVVIGAVLLGGLLIAGLRGPGWPAEARAADAVAEDEPSNVDESSDLIVEGVGWKNVRVGMTREELFAALGDPESTPMPGVLKWPSKHMDCTFHRGSKVVSEVRFNQGFPAALANGIKVGGPDTVLEHYGEPEYTIDRGEVAKEYEYSSRGILLWTSGGKVAQIVVFKPYKLRRSPARAGETTRAAVDLAPARRPEAVSVSRGTIIDTRFIPKPCKMFLILRPAEVAARPELAPWTVLFDKVFREWPMGLRAVDFRQVTVVFSETVAPSGEIRIFQGVKPLDASALWPARPGHGRVQNVGGKQIYLGVGDGSDAVLQYDEHTVIWAGNDQELRAYLAGKRGILPRWLPKETWGALWADHVVWALDMEGLQREVSRVLNEARGNQNSPAITATLLATLSPLWENSTCLVMGLRAGDPVDVHAIATGDTEDEAEAIEKTVDAARVLALNYLKQAERTVKEQGISEAQAGPLPLLIDSLRAVRVGREGTTVRAEGSIDLATVKKLEPAIVAAGIAGNRARSCNNLKMLALAMHCYHDAHKCFPPAVLYGPDGKTPYSWRVALLPYLEPEGVALHKQYHFDEPWDSPANREVLAKMPDVFRCPSEPAGSTNACYFALSGPGTIFDATRKRAMPQMPGMGGGGMGPMMGAGASLGPPAGRDGRNEGISFRDIRDGSSNTLLFVETKRDIPWTKPEDVLYAPDKPLPQLGGFFEGAFNVVFADGHVVSLYQGMAEKTLRALVTRDGREVVNVDEATQSTKWPSNGPPPGPVAPPQRNQGWSLE